MKTLKQLSSFALFFAIGTLIMMSATWLFEHHYINDLTDDLITILTGPILFILYFLIYYKK